MLGRGARCRIGLHVWRSCCCPISMLPAALFLLPGAHWQACLAHIPPTPHPRLPPPTHSLTRTHTHTHTHIPPRAGAGAAAQPVQLGPRGQHAVRGLPRRRGHVVLWWVRGPWAGQRAEGRMLAAHSSLLGPNACACLIRASGFPLDCWANASVATGRVVMSRSSSGREHGFLAPTQQSRLLFPHCRDPGRQAHQRLPHCRRHEHLPAPLAGGLPRVPRERFLCVGRELCRRVRAAGHAGGAAGACALKGCGCSTGART